MVLQIALGKDSNSDSLGTVLDLESVSEWAGDCMIRKNALSSRIPDPSSAVELPERPGWSSSWQCILMYLISIITFQHAAAAAKLLQPCPTLCDPIDGSPPGSPVPGILQARILEWVAISFSSAWKWKVKVKLLSHVRPATPWTGAYQAPPSMGFSRQEYWSGVPCPSPNISA